MRAVDIIQKKRDGLELSSQEIEWLIEGYVAGTVPDYQMSAFAMAVYFKGMTTREISDLTMAMVGTGQQFDLSAISGIKVDKHSTGGVGDKVTLILYHRQARVCQGLSGRAQPGRFHQAGSGNWCIRHRSVRPAS